MTWKIEYTKSALSVLKKLDKQEAKHIGNFISDRIANLYSIGILVDLWYYRVGNYRIITETQDQTICIIILRVGHRINNIILYYI